MSGAVVRHRIRRSLGVSQRDVFAHKSSRGHIHNKLGADGTQNHTCSKHSKPRVPFSDAALARTRFAAMQIASSPPRRTCDEAMRPRPGRHTDPWHHSHRYANTRLKPVRQRTCDEARPCCRLHLPPQAAPPCFPSARRGNKGTLAHKKMDWNKRAALSRSARRPGQTLRNDPHPPYRRIKMQHAVETRHR